jgi:hypothetical protein
MSVKTFAFAMYPGKDARAKRAGTGKTRRLSELPDGVVRRSEGNKVGPHQMKGAG